MTDQLHKSLPRDGLQEQLLDLLSLAIVADHVRWVVTGEQASELGEWLAGAASHCRAWADQVAEHMVSRGVAPDGRVRSVARDIPLHWVPDGWLPHDEAVRLVVYRLGGLAGWARYRQSRAADPDTAHLLETVSSGLEAYLDEGRRMLAPDSSGTVAAPMAR
jgi:starvation-inducible DNA-binding protein